MGTLFFILRSRVLAGIAGALFAINLEILTEENLGLAMSFNVLLATYIGGVGFFLGPVVGAVLFISSNSLSQTDSGFYIPEWYDPDSNVFKLAYRLFAMHKVWQLGRMNILVRPYSKIAIPIILFVIGAVCLTELINHVRHHVKSK